MWDGIPKIFINLTNHDTACNMPRKARIMHRVPYHIICRGIEDEIFRNNTNKISFKSCAAGAI